VGAVAMHGIRLVEAALGDLVTVIGLGLLGQLTVQMLKAAGCRVLGIDPIPRRTDLALRMGADAVCVSGDELANLCLQHSQGHGADAVLITAETPSSEPVNLAAQISRDRAIVVAVGTVGMDIDRKLYYQKELDFRVSRSYGPGRYDSAYEQKGRDYAVGYVRWTETRNMEAFIQLLANEKVDVNSLITHRFPIDYADKALEVISSRSRDSLAVLLTYGGYTEPARELHLVKNYRLPRRPEQFVSPGVLGAGNFATTTLLPAIKRLPGANLVAVCAANGSHARHAADKYGFHYCATDEKQILHDAAVNTVVIATRHNLHGSQVCSAITAGKHVFCEKPLCLTDGELAGIIRSYRNLSAHSPLLMVGFNRRFAPMAVRMKAFLAESREPLAMHYRVNAGSLPPDHWVNDPEQGGGRILGEVCHFVDFLMFLAGSPPIEVFTDDVASPSNPTDDNVIISLRFANGSQGTISYLTTGDRGYSKERVEVFAGGSVAVLDDFRRLQLVRHGRKRTFTSHFRQEKGHRAQLEAFFRAIRSGTEAPIPFDEIVATTLATLNAAESRRSAQRLSIDAAGFMARHT
jgi:predicted dehydrogenase